MRPICVVARDVGADLRHHLERHGLVALVFQIPRRPALGVVARHAFEVDERAVLAAQKLARERRAVDGIAGQREEISRGIGDLMACSREPPLTGGSSATSSPSASGAAGEENC